jgi:hypothetical protein
MNVAMKIAESFVPAFLKKRQLKKLFALAAGVFKSEAPSIAGLSFEESLRVFADYTQRETVTAIKRGEDLNVIKWKLFKGAYEIGDRLRKFLHVTDTGDIMKAGRLIYGTLGINFLGTPRGEVTINKCFFSEIYSARTCRVISSLDEGMMAGLSHGGAFMFSQRMTEGFDSCRANFIPKGTSDEKSYRSGHRCWWCNCC